MNRSPDLDVLPGFKTPPPGYGQVPFWWWSGEDLDIDRLLWQLQQLHEKGISGVQVNYSHDDTPGWPTDSGSPKPFTEEWWHLYGQVSEACAERDMGIGVSTYTLDWPNGAKNIFYERFYSRPELNALELTAEPWGTVKQGERCPVAGDKGFAVRAYKIVDGVLQAGGVDLTDRVGDGEIDWDAPEGEWRVWKFSAIRRAGVLNALMPGIGDTVVRGFFQPFEDHNPGGGSAGLNYFFNDELQVGLGKYAWSNDFAEQFRDRKGYDLLEVLPALWTDIGHSTPKVLIDYADVRMSLMEERYFEPIYLWHTERGIVYGCDNMGRGLEPDAYGDYFRACRWYTAPGHDTPGGLADLIKGKVSSSIANLYRLPRVQLEGYHSLGWGATPERIMEATCRNYLYGCNLLSLHGCYYSTRGSHWEWAPPCFHFRMPYWRHMETFFSYFERLSYVMSQGHHVCDVAVIYPVTPYEAELDGDAARDTAFEVGRSLEAAGIDFEFIDHQSLSRAGVRGARLVVSDAQASYRVLVVPNMKAMRWSSIEKAAAFSEQGGLVISVGALPEATDRAGRHDAVLADCIERAFKVEHRLDDASSAVALIESACTPDVRGVQRTVHALHRRVGMRDVYLVMDAEDGDAVDFRVHGHAELWDAWTGRTHSLKVLERTESVTRLQLPGEAHEARLVVFTPGPLPEGGEAAPVVKKFSCKILDEQTWQVCFEPTMDNRYGDFRLPVTEENAVIGLEARRFRWARETDEMADIAMQPQMDDSGWLSQLHGFGPKFFQLGLVDAQPAGGGANLDEELSKLRRIDPSIPVRINGREYHWKAYEFSWRVGREGDPGHQGFHGLKGTISDHFIRLGGRKDLPCGSDVLQSEGQGSYFLWTTVNLAEPVEVTVHTSEPAPAGTNASPVTAPSAVYVDGQRVDDYSTPLSLDKGRHTVLLRYDEYGESHFVLRRQDVPPPEVVMPLSMRWFNDPGVLAFDPFPGESTAEWFRFVTAPGTTVIRVHADSCEPVQAWCNGEPMTEEGNGYFKTGAVCEQAALVALRVRPPAGKSGGAALPEPIAVETNGQGVMPLGDWSKIGILHNYSGGLRYRTSFELTKNEAESPCKLDLSRVVATAEVWMNGTQAGVRVAPPWTFDLQGLLQEGTNQLEILICNTLSNHYQTIPSLYRGDPASGLFGPVKLHFSALCLP